MSLHPVPKNRTHATNWGGGFGIDSKEWDSFGLPANWNLTALKNPTVMVEGTVQSITVQVPEPSPKVLGTIGVVAVTICVVLRRKRVAVV